ncbi:MAG: hypothetical protein AB7T06_24765 [Kofleriaceae bacterium]
MKSTLPSEKLRQPASPLRAVGIIGVVTVLGVGAAVGIPTLTKPDTARDGASIVHLTAEPGKPTLPQITHKLLDVPHVAKSTTPPPPPEPEPSTGGGGSSGGGGGGGGGYSNSGALVPFIPSSDPNNAAGGDYMDPGAYCTSGSASGFPPVCD